jgi:DNA-binding YbaB/EbfC family protein
MNQQQQMMRQLQKMQADMQRAQQELAEAEVQGTAGGGMVTVTATGSGDIKALKIDPKAVDPDDVELLEDMVLAAIADARRAADAMQQAKLGGLTAGLNLPGF